MKKIFSSLILVCLMLSIGTADAFAKKHPKNVIFLIGDGMGIPHIYAGMVKNDNQLAMERCTYTGFSKTYSSNNFKTDSAAGGTALACGVKTKNGMVGMTPDSIATTSILEMAEKNNLATGIVVSCAVTHATPASFIAHQIHRDMNEEIAADYLKTDIDVFIGGGRKYFEKRKDGRNLIDELKENNYQVAYTLDDVKNVTNGKLAGLLYDNHPPAMPERGSMLPDATMAAIDILDNHKKGFFLMVEGSQIDWGGHDNDAQRIIDEVLDFDETIRRVLDFAEKDGNTLVIITADHETGGMTMPEGNMETAKMDIRFSTTDHSGVPVPVLAFGPGAKAFSGFMENTELKGEIENLLKLK